ncbi:CPBP family intramembrane glutamic endopeptidase [Corynebacterium spheniscorum]|uniref:CAAX protease self-immunity n=1 Tax=Corynebacterium spheniscorum TaxID=185761 RepID=A0A1I2QE88_9CORY|nr:CPBP family intramembrane glutamic endopeptidase [Corynebacterium spheniscorum]KAA8719644.1 CPBP family intramembrane metalloprotease [Corynebacterium spheniscorum]SFG25679.1 CAAX protease self-immunity [Corynebacterium spheniscorum]
MLSTQQHTKYPLRRFLPTSAGAWTLAILGAVAALFTLYLSVTVFHATTTHSPRMALAYLAPIALVVFLVWATGLLPKLRPSGQASLKDHLSPAWYLLFVALAVLLLALLGAQGKQLVIPSLGTLLTVIIVNLLIGLFEEILCRGFIQNILLFQARRTGRSVWWSIVWASIIFGVMHVTNLIGQPHLKIATLSQIIYAIAAGIILGTAYYISGNIWVVALIHGLVDFLSSFGEVLLPPATPGGIVPDSTLGAAIIQVMILLPGIWLAWHALRKHTDRIDQPS